MRPFKEIVKHHQDAFLLFCMISGLATAINYIVFFYIYEFTGAHYLLASATGYFVAIVLSFFLHKKFTFKSRSRAFAREASTFIFIYVGFFLAGLALLEVLVRLGMTPLFANIISVLATTLLTYFGCKNVAFRDKE
jgi:putative flippase GtrA